MAILRWEGPKEAIHKLKLEEAEAAGKKSTKKTKHKTQSRKTESDSKKMYRGKRR